VDGQRFEVRGAPIAIWETLVAVWAVASRDCAFGQVEVGASTGSVMA